MASDPSENYQAETARSYDTYNTYHEEKFRDYFTNHLQSTASQFTEYLAGPHIVDLGAGAGDHAQYFQQQGLQVLCIDNSTGMIKLCQRKGLNAHRMNLEQLELHHHTYDGVWANASLLHIPKRRIPAVIERMSHILKPTTGIAFIAVKEGTGEGFETRDTQPGTKRWFSYFTEEEFQQLCIPHFDILHREKKSPSPKTTFLHFFLRAGHNS